MVRERGAGETRKVAEVQELWSRGASRCGRGVEHKCRPKRGTRQLGGGTPIGGSGVSPQESPEFTREECQTSINPVIPSIPTISPNMLSRARYLSSSFRYLK